MATARNIELSVSDSGIYSVGIREDAARAASEVLQDDLENHHIYFNDMGFHTKFQSCLGKEENYPNFLELFQQKIEKQGVEKVINQYLFAEDELADNMLVRIFGGLIHPLIHLGFGIEFNQPAIIAEALAQAAIHDDWTGPRFLLPAEKAAGGIGKPGKKTMLQILEEIRADEKLTNSSHWEDGNRMRDGVLVRAPDDMIKCAAEFTVSENQLEEKLVEIINTIAYFTAAAQRPSKQVKLDFFYIHSMNASIFFTKIITLPFLSARTKQRLLEWTGRLSLLLYVSRNTPELRLNEVTDYQASRNWESIFAYANAHRRDDGHIGKLARAIANGEKVCRPYDTRAKELGLMITGDTWLKIGNMIMDSTCDEHSVWIRSTGFDKAWEEFEDRPGLNPRW
ncbi:hypothetical protein BBP40_000977 [Aspergillus hancockii]|nr:hypothetical protein BBP40_000977 [Aspergillus hancockii]